MASLGLRCYDFKLFNITLFGGGVWLNAAAFPPDSLVLIFNLKIYTEIAALGFSHTLSLFWQMSEEKKGGDLTGQCDKMATNK